MNIESGVTDTDILAILGKRVERHRIEAGLTQAELAERAGIGKRTLERLEAGRGTELVTLLRVLRILNSLEGLERLLPELPASPIEQLKLRGKQRQRAFRPRRGRQTRESSGRPQGGAPTQPWTWGTQPATRPLGSDSPRSAKKKV